MKCRNAPSAQGPCLKTSRWPYTSWKDTAGIIRSPTAGYRTKRTKDAFRVNHEKQNLDPSCSVGILFIGLPPGSSFSKSVAPSFLDSGIRKHRLRSSTDSWGNIRKPGYSVRLFSGRGDYALRHPGQPGLCGEVGNVRLRRQCENGRLYDLPGKP